MNRIKEVVPKEDYRLEVQLQNGSSIILNMETRLATVRFGRLANEEVFRLVSTDGNFIRWGDEIEISLSEVFLMVQK